MPPRYAFWTILIDQKPTAFRAREQSELLPTLAQLRRTNSDVILKWFSHGRVWDSPEQEREAQRRPKPAIEKRTREWRPGGTHADPRARFQKKRKGKSSDRRDAKPFGPADGKPFGSPRGKSFRSAYSKPPKRGPRR